MAGSSDANNVPEGTTLVFGSWACTADGSGGFSSHLVTPNSPKPEATLQPVDVCKIADPDEKRAILELSSDKAENVSTPTRSLRSAEFNTNSNSEKPHFSETLRKYATYLKSIKRPKINNSELLDGIDRVS
jgi:outer membrane protein OmpA-like peptidoglycan-associated protein